MRVTGIAVQVDANGVETHELTLVSYLQWLQEQFTYVSSKLGGAFVNALGTTPVAPSKYGTGQVPTWFSPAATLANLADVVGTGGTGGSPLVYNAATGQWQSASAANPATGAAAVPLVLGGQSGTTSIGPGAVTISALVPAVAPDGGAAAPVVPSVVHTPTGTVVKDATGSTRVIIGAQSDGTITVVEQNAAAPAIPDTPVVTGGPLGVVVTWDGLLAAGAPKLDFQYVQVHCSTSTGFTPSSATLQGTMAVGGQFGIGALVAGTTYYVKLVAYNNSNAASTPSAQASGVPSAPGGAKVTFAANASPPGSPTTGDLWYVTDQGNQLKTWNGSSWVLYQYGASAIATGSITSTQIAAAANITGSQLSSSAAIAGSQLAAAAGIVGTQLSSSAGITGTQLASSTITTTQLAGTVTARALGGITTTISLTAPGSPATGDMWINTTTGTIEQYSGAAWNVVTFNAANAIQASSITAGQIAAGTITATQLAANSVTASQLAANSITAADMLANTITASQIAASTITASQIAASTITATQIAANTITAGQILAGTITATQIAANTITAAKLAAGIVYAGIVDATTIQGAQLIATGTQGQVLIYNGTPGSGNLAGSWSGAAGTDTYGNTYPSGIAASQGTFQGSGIDGADLTDSTFTGGSVSGASIDGPDISGGTISETQITFDQVGGVLLVYSSSTTTATPTGTSWTAPAGTYTQGKVECWGADGAGSGGTTSYGGEAAGGGAYACNPSYPLTPGHVYPTSLGAAGVGGWTGSAGTSGGQAAFDGTGVVAAAGQAGNSGTGGLGGAAGSAPIAYAGGNGGNGNLGVAGAGGGGRAGSTGAGGNGGNGGSSAGAGGAAGTGTGGHAGGAGGATGTSGSAGGGGGGAGKGGTGTTYQTKYYDCTSTASYYGSEAGGGLRNTNGSMYQGCYSGGLYVDGDMESFGNYNSSAMNTDWSSWTIDQVTITLNNQHSWYNSGMNCILGVTISGTNHYAQQIFWTDEAATTGPIDITGISGLSAAIKAGTFQAIIFGPSKDYTTATDLNNYGYYQGGAGAGSPRITVQGHTGSGGSYQGGGGQAGVIKVTYTSSTTLIAAIAPAAGTDGSSNAYGAGYTGTVQAIHPGSSPTSAEVWQTASPPSGWSGTLRYKYVAESNMVYLDVAISHTALTVQTNVTLLTLPAAYRPAHNTNLECLLENNSTASVPFPSIYIPSATGVAVAYYVPVGTTNIDCHTMYPLD